MILSLVLLNKIVYAPVLSVKTKGPGCWCNSGTDSFVLLFTQALNQYLLPAVNEVFGLSIVLSVLCW